jgi:redox-sensitive bicupin YhaK (pirin superfamily)
MKTINKTRSVKALLYAAEYPMGQIKVRQPFPSATIEFVDPFILLHHADMEIPEFTDVKHAGVGPHPHRGFSPVTFIFKGGVHHRDSRGNNSVILAGGTQWMNAGMGVIHSERPPSTIDKIGGRQEIIQLWVNTPASHKMDQPAYFPLTAEDTPTWKSEDGLVTAHVIAGELFGLKGPIPALSPVNAVTIELEPGGKLEISLPETHNAFIYLLNGEIALENYGPVEGHHAVVFEANGEGIRFNALKSTRILLMTGEPLNEKIAAHGPFVMNTETELLEAMRDYRMGKMGILIEE